MKISANLKLHWTEVIYQRVNLESYKLQIIEKWNLLITQIVAYLKLYSNLKIKQKEIVNSLYVTMSTPFKSVLVDFDFLCANSIPHYTQEPSSFHLITFVRV